MQRSRIFALGFVASAGACSGAGRAPTDAGPVDAVVPGDGAASFVCAVSPGWTTEPSTFTGGFGIVADTGGTLHALGQVSGSYELHRRSSARAWLAPEPIRPTPTWPGNAPFTMAIGAGGQVVAQGDDGFDVLYRSAAAAWSLDVVGDRATPHVGPFIDESGTAHLLRRGAGLVHAERTTGGAWTTEPLPAELGGASSVAIGVIDGVLTVCGVVFPDVLCSARDTSGAWSTPMEVAPGIEARFVLSAGTRWVISNLVRVGDAFYSTHAVMRPTASAWEVVAMDVTPTPDSDVSLHRVVQGPSGAVHMVQAIRDGGLGADLDHAYVRYVRVDLDGSIVSQVVGCRSGWASIAVLPGDQPVVQFTSLALVETLLAFGPP